ncbi:hypothetical protein [Vibrio breoganii]|uniref:hypothetical protein n=1 Tax=Vibrio breoganii TaxID=553239 RepID=UPI0010543739|nr:hypothetical protein [Vibrio breoganii]
MIVKNFDGDALVSVRLTLCLNKAEEQRLERALWPEYDLLVEAQVETDEFYHLLSAQDDVFVPIEGEMRPAQVGMGAFEAYTPV